MAECTDFRYVAVNPDGLYLARTPHFNADPRAGGWRYYAWTRDPARAMAWLTAGAADRFLASLDNPMWQPRLLAG